jgi:hypothetical protein
VDGHLPAGGLGLGQLDLVAVPVHQHHPGARVLPVAGLGLAEGGGDDLVRAAGDRAGQPLGGRVRAAPHLARAAAPAGHGDHIVWPAGGRGRVVDAR